MMTTERKVTIPLPICFVSGFGVYALVCLRSRHVLERGRRSRSAKAGAYQEVLDEHYGKFSAAIRFEIHEEIQELSRRITTWKQNQLEQSGLALFNLEVDTIHKESKNNGFAYCSEQSQRASACSIPRRAIVLAASSNGNSNGVSLDTTLI